MIHSSINDNWMRVEIMHSVAQNYYETTHDSDFRERMINNGEPFPFDVTQYTVMEKESCVVGMVMAWSVVTLESLVNHSLAEIINNRRLAVMAIEFPRQVTDKLKIAKSTRSELSKKLAILSDDNVNNKYLFLADELSETRNLIVHDKPFNLPDYLPDCEEYDEEKITHFRTRGVALEKQLRYEDLSEFYTKCDQVKSYIFSKASLAFIEDSDISFASLINVK